MRLDPHLALVRLWIVRALLGNYAVACSLAECILVVQPEWIDCVEGAVEDIAEEIRPHAHRDRQPIRLRLDRAELETAARLPRWPEGLERILPDRLRCQKHGRLTVGSKDSQLPDRISGDITSVRRIVVAVEVVKNSAIRSIAATIPSSYVLSRT